MESTLAPIEPQLSYGESQAEMYEKRFLGNFLENPVIKQSGLEFLIRESANCVYWTTFTDDSGYITNGLHLMEFKEHWKDPKKRQAIVETLDFFYGTNWIVDAHVQDLAKEIGLSERYTKKDYPFYRRQEDDWSDIRRFIIEYALKKLTPEEIAEACKLVR